MGRIASLALFLAAGAATAAAQSNPQLTWQGEVSSPAMLRIQGDRVIVDDRFVTNVDYRFSTTLPRQASTVSVSVRRGRGDVTVVEQPRRANDFTAVFSLNPRGRRDFFVLDFSWDAQRASTSGSVFGPYDDDDGDYDRGRGRGRARGRYRNEEGYRSRTRDNYSSGSVTWTGRVDHEAIIEFRNRRASIQTIRGARPIADRVDFTAPIPNAEVTMRLVDGRGRGRVELVEQPSYNNQYTARVRVLDTDSGAGDYSFTLAWDGGDGNSAGSDTGSIFSSGTPAYGGGSRILLAGRVDGRIRVTVQGNRYSVQTLSGREPYDLRVSFGSALPNQPVNVGVDRKRGRDEVRVIERPSSYNGYRLVFEINDASGGEDFYEVEINW